MRLRCGAAAVTTLALFAVACSNGGSGESPLEDYFRDLEAVEQDAEEASADVVDPFDLPPEATLQERQQAVAEFSTEFRSIYEQYREDFDALEPPDETASAHDAYGDSLAAFFAAFEDFLTELGSAATIEEYNATDTQALQAALAASTEDCVALEEVATANDIEVDLRCNT